MSYKIIYTEEAEKDFFNIYSYIAMDLLVPETARNQVNRIIKAIIALDELPFRYKLYQDDPWRSKGLRVLPIDNYLVFYTVIEKENTVSIIRIMYAGRNIDLQLSSTKI